MWSGKCCWIRQKVCWVIDPQPLRAEAQRKPQTSSLILYIRTIPETPKGLSGSVWETIQSRDLKSGMSEFRLSLVV